MNKEASEIQEYRLRERNLEVFQQSLCDKSSLQEILAKCNPADDESLPDQSYCLSVSYALQRCQHLQ